MVGPAHLSQRSVSLLASAGPVMMSGSSIPTANSFLRSATGNYSCQAIRLSSRLTCFGYCVLGRATRILRLAVLLPNLNR